MTMPTIPSKHGMVVRTARALARRPYRPALVIAATAIVMGSLFVISYSLALGRPAPHEISAALVGDPSQADRALFADIEGQLHSTLRLHRYSNEESARQALLHQRVYVALVLTDTPPRMLIASAAGASVARVLTAAAQGGSTQAGRPLDVQDVRPLPPDDPQGLVAFYVTLAATVLGFVSIFQLRAHARGFSLGAWLGFIASLALVAGLALALLAGPVMGSLHGMLLELWTILALEIAAAALFNSTMLVLVGNWAIVPTWLTFVVLGNTSSGGAVAPPLLPEFYAFIGRWLSPGATVEALRGAVYFRHDQHAEPFLVLIAWVAGGLAALLAARRLRGSGPALPVEQ
jgi:hypothetical protein